MNKKKEFGVFYTPKEVVDKVYSLLPMSEINSIIDINCGDGALLRPYDKEKIVLGFDIEPKYEYAITRDSLNSEAYTKTTSLLHFDLCIGNPPYRPVRKNEYIGDTDKMNDFVHSNGSNLFIAGLYKAMEYNAEWYAFIIPKNFLTLDGYRGCREYIATNFHVYAICDLGRAFKDVSGEQVCIVFNRNHPTETIKMVRGDNVYKMPSSDFNPTMWVMFNSLTDKNLYEKLNKYSKIGHLMSCNVVEGIRGRDLDKFRLKNGQHNLHGDVILLQRIYSSSCGFKAVPASINTRCNESVKKLATFDVLCLTGLLHSRLINYYFNHYLFTDSTLTLKTEYAKYLPKIFTSILNETVKDMMINGWSKLRQEQLDNLVYSIFNLTTEERQMVDEFIERTWSKKWL